MKKILTFAAIAIITCSASAEWDMFKGHDKNKDGEITKEEWTAQRQKVAKKQGKKYNEKAVMNTFEKTDTDGSGTLSREEVEELQASWTKKKK
jgi:Ca2+-binding EF-hand superfamily protein